MHYFMRKIWLRFKVNCDVRFLSAFLPTNAFSFDGFLSSDRGNFESYLINDIFNLIKRSFESIVIIKFGVLIVP